MSLYSVSACIAPRHSYSPFLPTINMNTSMFLFLEFDNRQPVCHGVVFTSIKEAVDELNEITEQEL